MVELIQTVALFGNAASVLVGDFVHSRSFQMMVGLSNMQVMEILSDATNAMAEGEVLQLLNMHDPNVSQEAYLDVIRSKTAKLFEVAAQLGALISGASDADIEAVGEYGRSLGNAFQLIDDVLDYAGDAEAIGKNVGDDLREDKPTLPLIYLMENGTPEQRELVRNCIKWRRAAFRNDPGGNYHRRRTRNSLSKTRNLRKKTACRNSANWCATALSKATTSGALDFTRRAAEVAAQRAAAAIAGLPDSEYNQSLLQLCVFAVDRNH